MPLSKVALMCLESSAYLKYDILFSNSTSSKRQRSRPKPKPTQFPAKYKLLRDPDAFFPDVNMSLETFDYILEHVRHDLEEIETPYWKSTAEEKLFMTLRFLATGMTIKKLASTFCTGPITASKVVFSTLDAIAKGLANTHLRDPTLVEMNEFAKAYNDKWKFPNCVGAIGGKYIRIQNTTMGTVQKVIVNAVVDANFRFLGVHVLRKRDSEDAFVRNLFKVSGMQCLPGTEVMLPLVIIGNEAYPLKSNLMKPYPSRAALICEKKELFNDRLKQARVTVDCAFEILTEKWKVYTKPFLLSLDEVRMIVRATCLLHNVIKDREGDRDPHFSRFGQVDNGVIYLNLVTHKSRRNNRASSIAISIRDQLTEYIHNNNIEVVPEIQIQDE